MNNYPPTAEELRKYLRAHLINGHQAAEMLSVSRRTLGYWMRGIDHKGREISIPFSCWFTLRTKIEGTPPIKQIEHDGELWDVVSPSLAIAVSPPFNRQLDLHSGEPTGPRH